MVGFEHTTFCSQNRRATRLRYIPLINLHDFKYIYINLIIILKTVYIEKKQEERDSNPQPLVLETIILPIELPSFLLSRLGLNQRPNG